MMCPVGCNSTSPSRADSGQKYDSLDMADHFRPLHDASDTTNSQAFLPQMKVVEGMQSNSGRKTGCRLMDFQELTAAHEERTLATTKLTRALVTCLVFMVLEIVGGQFAGSLAVLADAAHMLSDVAGFAISLLALRASGWVATPQQTFGYFRLEVLGALISVQIIWVMTGIILYEAFQRLYHGIHIVDGRLMFCVACAGLVLNFIMIFILGYGHDHGDTGHGHTHSIMNEHNHHHDYDQLHDLEDGHCHRPKLWSCNDNKKHVLEKHGHDEEHEKINGCCLAEIELGNNCTEGQRYSVGSHAADRNPVDPGTHCSGEHIFRTNERPHRSHCQQSSQLGCFCGHLEDNCKHNSCPAAVQDGANPHSGDLDENNKQKLGVPLSRGEANTVISALREEIANNGKYVRGGYVKLTSASEMTSSRSSREQAFGDEIQGQGFKSSRERILNINLRGAYLHALGDLIQNIGVLITGLVIWLKPEWQFIDLLCSIVFSIVVIMTTAKMLKDIMWVLMESSSRDLDVETLKSGLMQISGISAVSDLHVWALTPGLNLLSCHVEIKPGAVAREVLHDASEYCYNLHNIKHVTIQIEDAPQDLEDVN